eukprot:CAMPEP_0172890842 /NCGR_PEP_ID=MMETSP1075-20121228/142289_1 /TAXON_ID=2916 /ORGANISM="Ceratium fusus, Strain PA161109" /LENGTH=100 /DNA_ID=CAMNT_0013745179 /DNA_START=1 /DNA_END=303 /DNA_ORIENTATION=-
MMLRQAVSIASRRAALSSTARTAATQLPAIAVVGTRPQLRAFAGGALQEHKPETAVARPFKGASVSEPDMEYIEEPSMLYMSVLIATPWVFSFWFLTKFV